jgi:hypothetical protein
MIKSIKKDIRLLMFRNFNIGFLTEDEIIIDILKSIEGCHPCVEHWLSITDLSLHHHTTGRKIRNDYKLWFIENNKIDICFHNNSENHPDQISQRIMERVIKRLSK